MIRLIGCVIVIFAGLFAGMTISDTQKQNCIKINALINSLKYMKSQLSTYNAELEEVFLHISEREPLLNELCSTCIRGINEGVLFSEAWKRAIETYTEEAEIKEIILPLGNILGKCETEDECEEIGNSIVKLQLIYDFSINEYKEKKKLFSKMGILLGSFIAILLI